ncbi:MAG: phosphotransferase [Parachlamydiaceae bacterium]
MNVQLFGASTSLQIRYKEAQEADRRQVRAVCVRAGIPLPTSISQPEGSAELNSQNFILRLPEDETLLLRRCKRLQGKANYEVLNRVLSVLRTHNVHVPELYFLPNGDFPYLEMGTEEKVDWVFFKYLQCQSYFSGSPSELKEAAYQIGKMHAVLKAEFGKEALYQDGRTQAMATEPFLTTRHWGNYLAKIREKASSGKADSYDQQFLESQDIIYTMASYVEDHFKVDHSDWQNIHFDLNSTNFLLAEGRVTIMDFDEIKLGNVYTDIGFALHRLVATAISQGHYQQGQLVDAIQRFISSYQEGNPELQLDKKKLIVAMYDRALRNVKTNLELKYDQGSSDWLTSIPVNLKRLEQVVYLVQELRDFHD